MRVLECLAALAIPVLLAGCRSSETLEREGPSEAPALPVAAPPATASATAATATVVSPRLPAGPAATSPASSDAGAPSGAGQPQDAGSADAAAGGATSTAAKLKACADKCQPALQGCLTPSFSDAGMPQLKDPKACQAAFEACQAACK